MAPATGQSEQSGPAHSDEPQRRATAMSEAHREPKTHREPKQQHGTGMMAKGGEGE